MFIDSNRFFSRIGDKIITSSRFSHIFLTSNYRTRPDEDPSSSFIVEGIRGTFRRAETIFRSPESSPFGSATVPRGTKGAGKYRNVPRATPYKSLGCNPVEAVHYGGTNHGFTGITEKSLRRHFKRKRVHRADQLDNERDKNFEI